MSATPRVAGVSWLTLAVNTYPIATFGTCSLSPDIGFRRLFPWVVVAADIPCAILGTDFLTTTNLTVRDISSCGASRQLAALGPESENPFRQPLAKYPGLTRPNFGVSIPAYDVIHSIRTTGHPVFSRLRRLAPARLFAAKAEFEDMGTIRQSESFWVDFSGDLFIKSVFSETDLVRASHKIPIAPEDASNTAVNPPPLASLSSCACQLDSATPSRLFREVLEHLVDSNGIHPLPSMVTAIRDFPPPSSKRQLQRFLDMVYFYRRSLPHCADTVLLLKSLLSGSKGSFELSANALAAFDKAKVAVADAALLTHFSPDATISHVIDASNVAVGAVLQQHVASHTQPLAFFPRMLSPVEMRYSAFG
nr:unnamed protein product [Spirometra erinaceieuropaei]